VSVFFPFAKVVEMFRVKATFERDGNGPSVISLSEPAMARTPAPVQDNEKFLQTALNGPKLLHYRTTSTYAGYRCGDVPSLDPFANGAVSAFKQHHGFELSPQMVWFAVANQIATYVKLNSQEAARFFTSTPEAKQKIEVVDNSLTRYGPNDWSNTVGLFKPELEAKMTKEVVGLFIPKFSEATVTDELSFLVALMDAGSPFYHYVVTTRCGIPKIRVRGSAADWAQVSERLKTTAEFFPGLETYAKALEKVVSRIEETIRTGSADPSFWTSFYNFHNHSGVPTVSGWITALYAYDRIKHQKDPQPKKQFDWEQGDLETRLDQFPLLVSTVPFLWDFYGTKIDMQFSAGALGSKCDGEFITPELGLAVSEK
jgi:hypothetical protein